MQYIVYEKINNRNIFITNEFNHAFKLCFEYNNEARNGEKYDIKIA